MKKNDFILAGAVLAVALVFMFINNYLAHEDGALVTVTVDGEIYGTYSLKEEQEISINGTNLLIIKEGKADMTEADCPDKLCVHQKAISKDKETIVCLPNKIVAEVHAEETSELDSITN